MLDLYLSNRIVDLVEEGFDLALRVMHKELGSSLLTQRICPIRFMLVGSLDYLQRNGHPKSPDELLKHVAISYHYSQFADEMFFHGPNGRQTVKLVVALRTNNTIMEYQAALAGMGLALLPELLVEDDLNSHRLEVLKLDYILSTSFLYAVYTSRRYLAPKLRTFVDFLAEHFSRISDP